MQSDTGQAAEPSPAPASSDGAAVALAQDEVVQVREELRVLMFGFATGMTVAAVFFIYVLLATARLLP